MTAVLDSRAVHPFKDTTPPQVLRVYTRYVDAANWETETEGVGVFAKPALLLSPLIDPLREAPKESAS